MRRWSVSLAAVVAVLVAPLATWSASPAAPPAAPVPAGPVTPGSATAAVPAPSAPAAPPAPDPPAAAAATAAPAPPATSPPTSAPAPPTAPAEQPRREPAPGTTATGVPTPEERGRAALALIAFPWQDLGYEIVFLPARDGLRARTLRLERRIEVYVRPTLSDRQIAFDIAHELGHAVDFTRLSWEDRARWQAARGIAADVPWFGCNACTDYATPAGDWAESFAVAQLGDTGFRGQLAPVPDAGLLALLQALAA